MIILEILTTLIKYNLRISISGVASSAYFPEPHTEPEVPTRSTFPAKNRASPSGGRRHPKATTSRSSSTTSTLRDRLPHPYGSGSCCRGTPLTLEPGVSEHEHGICTTSTSFLEVEPQSTWYPHNPVYVYRPVGNTEYLYVVSRGSCKGVRALYCTPGNQLPCRFVSVFVFLPYCIRIAQYLCYDVRCYHV